MLNFFAKDTELNLEWDTGDIMTGVKKLASILRVLEDFQYERTNSFALILLFFLNSEMLSGEFEFQNANFTEELPQLDEMK